MAAVGTAGEWVVAVEWHNPTATRRRWRVLPQLAAATCVTWYQGESRLFHSSQRRLRGAVDPWSPVAGADPGFWAPYFAEQSVPLPGPGATGYRTAMLTAAQRLTGTTLAPAWLDQPQLLVPLLPGYDGDTGLRPLPRGWPQCVD